MKADKRLLVLFLPVLLVGLPLAGVLVAGLPVYMYWEFPPLTRYVSHAPFSWIVFVLLLLLGLGTGLLLGFQLRSKKGLVEDGRQRTQNFGFPWWSMFGLLLVCSGWIVAWNRFPWCQPFQAHTFMPLWFGYILVVNGLTFYRTGRCLLTGKVRFFLLLFVFSMLFWWFFEYLNRFVQNWYYVGVEDFSTTAYIIHASLAFSTVLPAVLSTEELLATFPRLTSPLRSSFCLRISRPIWPVAAILLLCLGLAGIGIWPDFLFAALWLSPVALVVTAQHFLGQKTFFHSISSGDWRPVWLPALAALCCGFFWEMWNVNSYAHWVYSIPFVERFYIFEMPLLGYLGYLPFGLECRGVAELIDRLFMRNPD